MKCTTILRPICLGDRMGSDKGKNPKKPSRANVKVRINKQLEHLN